MTRLGKCLAFHLNYGPEMQRLYWRPKESGEPPDTRGLGDAKEAKEILDMVRAVADTACREAADFLELCLDAVERHFTSFPTLRLKKRAKRAYLERHWSGHFTLKVNGLSDRWFLLGVGLWGRSDLRPSPEDGSLGAVVPWLWGQGGRKGESAFQAVLGGRVHSRSGEGVVADRGSVALRPVFIHPEEPGSFEVTREPLIEQVARAFAGIQPDEVEALMTGPAGGKDVARQPAEGQGPEPRPL